MDNLTLALTLLLAGFTIVFLVLILLIIVITVYGKIIQAAQKSSEKRKAKKIEQAAPAAASPEAAVPEVLPANNDEIPGEIIAVIAAAVDAVYGNKPHKIKAVRRSRSARSSWGNAGVAQNTRPF